MRPGYHPHAGEHTAADGRCDLCRDYDRRAAARYRDRQRKRGLRLLHGRWVADDRRPDPTTAKAWR